MSNDLIGRRQVIQGSIAWAGAMVLGRQAGADAKFRSANDRPRMAAIGTGSRWSQKATGLKGPWGSAKGMAEFADYVAVCDADGSRRELAAGLVKEWSGKSAEIIADYRAIIDRRDIDVVHISTPDHWHAKMAIEAMNSGKDVYCEKPMTLTIEEGRLMVDTCRKTGSIVQIGTQQRSEETFLQAIALIRDGRIGKLKKATCVINSAPSSPEVPVADAPKSLDWNNWLGPAPLTPFRYIASNNGETKSWSRCHYEFRWWYEYSGGKMTDWGAHHVDIAMWALGMDNSGPISVEGTAKHPVPFENGMPTVSNRYNTATEFMVTARFAGDVELIIRHDTDNGVLIEGTDGRIFVSRGALKGAPAEDLAKNPLPEDLLKQLYKGKEPKGGGNAHMENFFQCVKDRGLPVSDVYSHHRAMTTCHLANIAIRLGQKIEWNPETEQIVNNPSAAHWIGREQRKGYEIDVTV